MRSVVIGALVAVLLGAAAVDAQTNMCAPGGSATIGYDYQVWLQANTLCVNSDGLLCDWSSLIRCAGQADSSAPVCQNKFQLCAYTGTSGTDCCVDKCAVRKPNACMPSKDDKECLSVPSHGSTNLCMQRNKVCAYLGQGGNATMCNMFSFCKYENNMCSFHEPTVPEGGAPESVADKCPKLHPVVVAMLALMFVTFVGAVVLVAVVVYRNQKKFDEEEERRMQIQAAQAEAKRARRNRSQL